LVRSPRVRAQRPPASQLLNAAGALPSRTLPLVSPHPASLALATRRKDARAGRNAKDRRPVARRLQGSGPDRQPGRDAYARARRCRTRPRRLESTNPIVRRGDHQGRPGNRHVAEAIAGSAAAGRLKGIVRAREASFFGSGGICRTLCRCVPQRAAGAHLWAPLPPAPSSHDPVGRADRRAGGRAEADRKPRLPPSTERERKASRSSV
jgi:hypothetical protein